MGLLKVLAMHSLFLGAAHGEHGANMIRFRAKHLELSVPTIGNPRAISSWNHRQELFHPPEKRRTVTPTPNAPECILVSQQKPDSSHQSSQTWRHANRTREFFLLATQEASRILVGRPGIEPTLPALGNNHWITREVLPKEFFFTFIQLVC